MKVFAIQTKTKDETRVTFVNAETRETEAVVNIAPAGTEGEFLAYTDDLVVVGYRHRSITEAVKFYADQRDWHAVSVSAAHPSVRAFLSEV